MVPPCRVGTPVNFNETMRLSTSHTTGAERARGLRAHATARAIPLARLAPAASAVAAVHGWIVAHAPRKIGSRPVIHAGAATELALIAAAVVAAVVGQVRASGRAHAFRRLTALAPEPNR